MTKVYFAGHDNFGNRGCEALVRSIAGIVQQRIPDTEFITPSHRIDLDKRQWPQSANHGIRFVDAPSLPGSLKWWNRARKVLPPLERARPKTGLPVSVQDAIAKSDILVMTGGDVISIDYDLSSLYFYSSFVDLARKLGKPAFLWGASVGPFSRMPHIERIMARQLADYDFITVREADSLSYLTKLGLKNIAQVADPAFTLQPEPFDLESILPLAQQGVVGINVSPLIRKYRNTETSQQELDRDVILFAKQLCDQGYGVIFIPHVGPLDNGPWNNDHSYMKGIIERFGGGNPGIRLAPHNLNAAQLKYLLSRLRFFIGARTHATIGAISSCVPTVSIAYSVKAKGINKDIFGDERFVLETPEVSIHTLGQAFSRLLDSESDIRCHLEKTIPAVKSRAEETAIYFEKVLYRR